MLCYSRERERQKSPLDGKKGVVEVTEGLGGHRLVSMALHKNMWSCSGYKINAGHGGIAGLQTNVDSYEYSWPPCTMYL